MGNREEFDVMEHDKLSEGYTIEATVKNLFEGDAQLVVVKNGKEGSRSFLKSGDIHEAGIFQVQALKPYGAGDAFISSLSYAFLNDLSTAEGVELGAAAAAIVVSKEGCAEAMPTIKEIKNFIKTNRDAKTY